MYIVVFNGIRFVVCYYIEIDVGRSKLGIFYNIKDVRIIYYCVLIGVLIFLGLESFINEIYFVLKYRN